MPNYLGVQSDELAGVKVDTVVNGSSSPVVSISPTGSPFSYVAPAYGTLNVSGGTVSQVAIKRGGVTTNLGGIVGHFLASKGDTYVITYSVAPTLSFIPN